MSLAVEERKERENQLFPLLLVHFVSNTLCSSLPGRGKYISFTMTAQVAGSTHSVLLEINVIFVKECEESNSPTP